MRNMLMATLLGITQTAMAQSGETQAGFRQQNPYFTTYISQENHLVVTGKADSRTMLDISLDDYDAAQYILDTSFSKPYTLRDLNFDGYPDLSFPSHSGNVQRFEEVYLYNPQTKTLERNEMLSGIACLDINERKKQVSGLCFHSSAAENWTETYRWEQGDLILWQKEGTMPCPADESCYYTYKQKRVKGKMTFVYKKKKKI